MIGVRRAIALLFLGFYVTQFAMTALLGPDELFAAYTGLALVYAFAFFGLAAGWFWARWFAIGVGQFGSLLLLLLISVGFEPIIFFIGITHVAISLSLVGEGMAAEYEHSERTAERWNFHEETLLMMRRAVKSVGSTLPLLILYALAPRAELLNYLMLATGLVGFWGLLRGRTWSIFLLGATGLVALADGAGLLGDPTIGYLMLSPDGTPMVYGQVGILTGGLILLPLMFAPYLIRWFRR